MATDGNLTRDDLVLLMESYRNTISMHQAILDQSTKMVEMANITINKLDTLTTKQSTICNELHGITRNMEEIIKQSEKRLDKIGEIGTQINEHEKKSIEDHGKLIRVIHVAWAGMGTIILSLIGLGYTIYNSIGRYHP